MTQLYIVETINLSCGSFRSAFKPFIFSKTNNTPAATKSPEVAEGAEQINRKHPLWLAVEDWEEDEEKLTKFQNWCLEFGEQERKKPFKDVSYVFQLAVEKEMEFRRC